MLPEDRYISGGKVAVYLGVSPRTLSWWRKSGQGPPFVRVGHRTVRYRVQDVEDYRDGLIQGGATDQRKRVLADFHKVQQTIRLFAKLATCGLSH